MSDQERGIDDILARIWARNRDLSEDEAMDLALKAVDEVRSERG